MKKSEADQDFFLFFLSKIKNLGPRNILTLLKKYGSPPQIVGQALSPETNHDRVLDLIKESWGDQYKQEKIREAWTHINEDYLTILDQDYPPLLKNIYDPPLFLYYRGQKKLLGNPQLLTVVGSRKLSNYHQQLTSKIIGELQNTPLIIVSGLAYGLDAWSHRCALENKLNTIAVLGSGLSDDDVYPQENLSLAQDILKKGGLLLSELPSGTPLRPYHFPQRNRILAGLSRATVIISGAKKSGALITAQVALEEGREVLALPGNVQTELNWGPNQLLKNGANWLEGGADILKIYGLRKPLLGKNQLSFTDALEKDIYDCLRLENLSPEKIADKLHLPLTNINTHISQMELKGLVKTNLYNQIEIKD